MNQKEQKAFDEQKDQITALEAKLALLSQDPESLTALLQQAIAAKEELEARLEELQASTNTLESKLSKSKEDFENVSASLTKAKEENKGLQTLVDEQAAQLGKLQEQLDNPSKATASAFSIPVEHDGKMYNIIKQKFRIAGDPTLYTAEEAANNPALLDKLIEMKLANIIQEEA